MRTGSLQFVSRRFAAAVLIVAANAAIAQMTPSPGVAARLQSRIDAFHKAAKSQGEKLKVVYFTPADREPLEGHRERLTRIMLDIQSFYREEMERNGFRSRTFPLEMDGDQLQLHYTKGALPHGRYSYLTGELVRRDIRRTLRGKVDLDKDYVLIICGLCEEDDEGKFIFNSPYYGDGGANHRKGHCFAADCRLLDTIHLSNTKDRISYWEHRGDFDQHLARFNTAYIGGIAHELGHGLGLPHNGQNRAELQQMGHALMGVGNHHYRRDRWEKRGAFMTLASCLRLAAHPLFTGSRRAAEKSAKSDLRDLAFEADSTELSVSGSVTSEVEPVAVIVYIDPDGGQDYDARTWVAEVVNGRFSVVSNNWRTGPHVIRISVVHVNGEVSTTRLPFGINRRREPDVAGLNARWLIGRAEAAVYERDWDAVRRIAGGAADAKLNEAQRAALAGLAALETGNRLVDLKRVDADELFLSDAKARKESVGWGRPARNHYYFDRYVRDGVALRLGGVYHPKGLYAHAPSTYTFDLGGRWKNFTAHIGLQEGVSEMGSGIWIVEGDGKELFRSAKLHGTAYAKIEVDVKGVKALTLRIESGKQGNGNCWTVWGSPKVTR